MTDCYIETITDLKILREKVEECEMDSSYGKETQGIILGFLDKEVNKIARHRR